MRFATIAKVNEDSTVDIDYGPGESAASIATMNGYDPIPHEQVIVADVDGVPVVLGAVFNAPNELEQS